MKLKKYLTEVMLTKAEKLIPIRKTGTVNTETGEWKEKHIRTNLYDMAKDMVAVVYERDNGKKFISTYMKRDAGKVGETEKFKRRKSKDNVKWFEAKIVDIIPISKLKKTNFKIIEVWE